MNRQLNSLSPTIVLVVGAIINHMYRDNKEMEVRDLMLILSPTLPTVLPIIISIISDCVGTICELLSSFDWTKLSKYDVIPFNKITSSLSLFFNSQSIHKEEEKCVNNFSEYENVLVDTNLVFMQLLISYINTNKATTKVVIDEEKRIKLDITNKKLETQNWKHITILYKNIEIYLTNITLTFYKTNNELMLENFQKFTAQSKLNDNCKHFVRLADFIMNTNQKNLFIEQIDKVYMQTNNKISLNGSGIDKVFANTVSTVCPKIDKKLFITEYVVLHLLYKLKWGNSPHLRIISYYNSTHKLRLFGCDLEVEYKFGSINNVSNEHCSIFTDNMIKEFELPDEFKQSMTHMHLIINNLNSSATKNSTIYFNIKKLDTTKNSYAYDELNEFIEMIQNSKPLPQEGNKIKIYNTKIIKEEINNAPNPNYLKPVTNNENIERNKQMDPTNKVENDKNGLDNKNKQIEESNEQYSSYTNKCFDEFNMHNLTKKQRKQTMRQHNKISYKTTVSTKQINEKYKSFNTTYLRKDDTHNLINTLDIFKTESKLFEEYGLPNKLGIMLYGEPGTGKTTTIHAIASYLQKNIYYVNLNTIETNEELQMVFDHVFVESMNGGIIVFEDIDVMTSVVHKRDTNTNKNEKMNEKLTLEYFLNLLQGSLTRDGTIFIATTNCIEKLDPAFCRVGRFDVKINMKKCDHYQIKTIYDKFVKKSIDNDVLNKIREDQFTPAEIIFHLMNYIKSKTDCKEIMYKFMRGGSNNINEVNHQI